MITKDCYGAIKVEKISQKKVKIGKKKRPEVGRCDTAYRLDVKLSSRCGFRT